MSKQAAMALSSAAASLLPPSLPCPPKPTSALTPLRLPSHAYSSNPYLGSRIRKTSHISSTNTTKFAVGVLRSNNEVPELASASTIEEEEEEAEASTSSENRYDDGQEERGFLKLTQARDWSLGVNAAPFNLNQRALEREQARADRRRLSDQEYTALKKDLSSTTVKVAVAVDAYIFLTISPQVAISYALGAIGSYLYLELLYRHADAVSRDNVAQIFQRRKVKKIGIRSSDVQESLEKAIRGCGISLSSPRLVIPAGLYALWAFSTHYTGTSSNSFHLEVVPLMLGFFAYKAAALIQAYRDNKDLMLVIAQSKPDSPLQ